MELIFNANRIPRTTTRKEWREMWRWKRVTTKVLRHWQEENIEVLREFHNRVLLEGSAQMRIRDNLVAELINPPLLIPPWA